VTHKTYNEDLPKATPKQQAVYFNYRHAYPDNNHTLFTSHTITKMITIVPRIP
jgi:hypothetical protein